MSSQSLQPSDPLNYAAGSGAPFGTRPRKTFSEDFRRFFVRGLAAVMPTLITLWLIVWVWNFLWNSLGRHIITLISLGLGALKAGPRTADGRASTFERFLYEVFPGWLVQLIGVLLAIVLVYFVGMLVGNFIGRAFWRLAELAVMKVPIIRAIYPAVKQVTDFVLADRKGQFEGSRVVAVRPHEDNIWSIGLVTGAGPASIQNATGQEMVTVFVPSTPTAFSGYTLVVPRKELIDLPLTVEEAMRLLISGGVITTPRKTDGAPVAVTVVDEDGTSHANAIAGK